MNILSNDVGEMIKELRLKRNLSLEQLSENVGKHRSYIGRIETKD